MKLADYLASRQILAPKFAQLIGATTVSVHRYCAGTRIPEPELMRRIMRVTDGLVQPNDFYGVHTESNSDRRRRSST